MGRHRMRRATGVVAVLTLTLVTACGGDDDTTDAPSAETADTTDDTVTETTDAPATTEPVETTEAVATTVAPATTEDAGADDDGSGGGIVIDSIDDIPEVCRDLMADFLREIEPVVEPIDWQNASFDDFDAIAADFEALSEDFEDRSADLPECDDIELDDDSDFTLLIEFAEDVAPGTVSFLEFLSGFADALPDENGELAEGAAFDDCAGAIAFVEELMSQYDSLQQVPMSQMTALTALGTVLATCTPEELAFFDREDVQDFISG